MNELDNFQESKQPFSPEAYAKKLNRIFIPVVVIGFIFKNMHWPGGSILLIISLSTLSLTHLFAAFNKVESDDAKQRLFRKVSNYAFTLAFVAIMFSVQHYPGGPMMMNVATALLVVSAILLFIQGRENGSKRSHGLKLLTVFAVILGVQFRVIVPYTLLRASSTDERQLVYLFISNDRNYYLNDEENPMFSQNGKAEVNNLGQIDLITDYEYNQIGECKVIVKNRNQVLLNCTDTSILLNVLLFDDGYYESLGIEN